METMVIREKQDLTYLKWDHIRSSSGTAGTFLKSESTIGPKKVYYKLSNFNSVEGIVGHECVNEIIVDRLLTVLGVEHLHYQLVYADVKIDGLTFTTYVCRSEDFKEKGESKVPLYDYYRVNAKAGESHYDFCVRNGWKQYIDEMLAVDYIILNRDRHGANVEVLRNSKKKTLRIAPLFDHGVSLLYSCKEEDVVGYDVMEDRPCQNFIGSRSCYENLKLLDGRYVFKNELKKTDKNFIFEDLDGVLSDERISKIWEMIWKRYKKYMKLNEGM
ncbi:MAG: hypothetical protein K6B67_01035 [Lachnospiraceae bacterium]|nr:hypothetical protein [Lachnospiraceae bacterium]